ncbi:MAG: hypothetical protein M3Y65_11060 [Pseudomonadota bacterium]|nr:hypothetical protein [Pseudomonadota bacterium]
MKIDYTSITAVLRTNVRGGVTSVAHAVRRCAIAGVLAATAVVAMAPAHAQDRGGFRKDDQSQSRDERNDRNDHNDRNNARQETPRFDQRALEDARRQQQQQDRNADAQRHSGRLTPDERRDLRRQINEAGVDLYPNTPRR